MEDDPRIDVVLSHVATDKPDEDAFAAVIYSRDQSIFIAVNVEDHAIVGDNIGAAEYCFD